MYYGVLVGGTHFHGGTSLTYSSDIVLVPGQLVEVPLRNRTAIGVVESKTAQLTVKVKPIIRELPLHIPPALMKLLSWLKDYYPASIGSLVELFLPSGVIPLRTTEAEVISIPQPVIDKLPPLTTEQVKALARLQETPQGSILLHGDTGTGKTRLYIEQAVNCIKNGRSVLVLTPEIGLTQPLAQQFIEVFDESRVLVTHSAMTTAARRKIWQRVAQSVEPIIVIGPRSALFTPLSSIGLIVIDEAHDSAYKQEQAPHYLASRVGAQLARFHKAQLILGTATPVITDYWQFAHKSLPIIRLTKPAITSTHKTTFELVDLRDNSMFSRSQWLSTPLIKAMEKALGSNRQSLLFLNRRGSARLILCSVCGWQAVCPNCDSSLTYHDDHYQMLCHSCGYQDAVPTRCPECEATELIFRVPGTKALQAELIRLFPRANIGRFDSDNTSEERLHKQFDSLKSGNLDIIIGTQTITKGFDLPKLSVIGVIQADSGLQIPDFTASERMYQLLSQVSGRLGRGHGKGQVFIQAYRPERPLITWALERDYAAFYKNELTEREQFHFPPFVFLLKITARRASRDSAQNAMERLSTSLRRSKVLDIIGPAPSFSEKQNGKYTWQIVIKSATRSALLQVIAKLPANYQYDIDPLDLL